MKYTTVYRVTVCAFIILVRKKNGKHQILSNEAKEKIKLSFCRRENNTMETQTIFILRVIKLISIKNQHSLNSKYGGHNVVQPEYQLPG